MLAGLAGLCLARPGHAQSEPPKQIGTAKQWTAYTLGDSKTGICYVVTGPDRQEPAKLKRGDAHLLVTHRPGEKATNVVSIELGYAVTKGADAAVKIDKQSFSFFTDRETAWTRDAETDKAVVTAMTKAGELVIKAKSAKGNETTDSYALAGFPEALAMIDKACKVKR